MSTNLVDRSWRAFCSIWKIVGNYLCVKKLLVQSTTESLITDTHWVDMPSPWWVASFFVQTSVPRSRACLRTGRGNKNVYALQTSLSNTWPLNSGTNDSLQVVWRKSWVSQLYATAMIWLLRYIYTRLVLFSWKTKETLKISNFDSKASEPCLNIDISNVAYWSRLLYNNRWLR